jgi:hypothetical protein
MIEENIDFEKKVPELSSRTLSFYGTHQRQNKSKILYTGGNELLNDLNREYINLKTEYIFHICFQLSNIVDFVSNLKQQKYIFNL